MLETWPRQVGWYPRRHEAPSDATTLLTRLIQLQDTVRIDSFLVLLATAVFSKDDNASIVRAVSLLPPERAATLLEHLIASQAATNLSACGDLLARSVAARVPGRSVDLSRAATALVEALPGDPTRMPQRDPWSRARPVEPGFLVDLFTALGQIDAAMAQRAADHILAWPQTYKPDAILVPAVLDLTGQAAPQATVAIQRLRTAVVEHLRVRITELLEPPRDWVRANPIACSCAHCRDLSQFLAAPDCIQLVWLMPLPKIRSH
jgi:hypothetical protein